MRAFKIITAMVLFSVVAFSAYSKDFEDVSRKKNAMPKVLVLGLNDNVNSNYFPDVMITEETGIPTDSIDIVFNKTIADNIAEAANKVGGHTFVSSFGKCDAGVVVNEIKLNGSEEEIYADLSDVENSSLEKMLTEADADYLLILNQHYLKWQEQPMRTMFYFVSYSLFDKNKNEITRGNNYFTCMKPEGTERLRKSSKKSSTKIASAVIKTLNNK